MMMTWWWSSAPDPALALTTPNLLDLLVAIHLRAPRLAYEVPSWPPPRPDGIEEQAQDRPDDGKTGPLAFASLDAVLRYSVSMK
jgi:hypothetical protein